MARLLVQNNESEERAAEDTRAIYRRAERNVYVFLAAVLIVVVLTSIYLLRLQPPHVRPGGGSLPTAAANWRNN